VDIQAVVTPRRLGELARYGMGVDVAQLKRHGQDRRMATLNVAGIAAAQPIERQPERPQITPP
jgi:hypothetical protein